jgi:hypothetical protein
MHEALNDLENRLDKLLGKGSPYQMREKNKRALAGAAWAIALIIGILQAWGALAFWRLGHVVNGTIINANFAYGGAVLAPQLDTFFYISFIVIAVDAVLLLLAVSPLKDLRKHGWDLLYYSLLINVVYGFLRAFSSVGGGLGEFIVELFFSALVGYFLFQIREIFMAGKPKEHIAHPRHAVDVERQVPTKEK